MLLPPLLTYSRVPAGLIAIADGLDPTLITSIVAVVVLRSTTLFVAVSITATPARHRDIRPVLTRNRTDHHRRRRAGQGDGAQHRARGRIDHRQRLVVLIRHIRQGTIGVHRHRRRVAMPTSTGVPPASWPGRTTTVTGTSVNVCPSETRTVNVSVSNLLVVAACRRWITDGV